MPISEEFKRLHELVLLALDRQYVEPSILSCIIPYPDYYILLTNRTFLKICSILEEESSRIGRLNESKVTDDAEMELPMDEQIEY